MNHAVLCIDYLGTSGAWNKDWESLHGSILTKTLDDVLSTSTALDFRVALIHESALNNFRGLTDSRLRTLLSKLAGCIGVVSGGTQCNTEVNDDGRICRVKTVFPNLPASLDSLAPEFAKLLENLAVAENAEDRKHSWYMFDSKQIFDYLPALSLLCQGFLADFALKQPEGEDLPEQVHKALSEMGWMTKDSPWAAAEAVRGLELGPGGQALGLEFWTSCFEAAEGKKPMEVLKAGLVQEMEGGVSERVLRLLESIEKGSEPEVDTVAGAYLDLAAQLEKAAC